MSNQTDSVLTDSTAGESNFIAMLQYDDAFHLLGLNKKLSPTPIEIRAAYNTCREQTIAVLERCEATERQQAGRGTFLISQTNYLELKLNALDQALHELIPEEGECHDENDDGNSNLQQRVKLSKPLHQEIGCQQTPPSATTRTDESSSKNALAVVAADDDDLDTIDVYFNSPKAANEPKTSDQSDVISMITWDASSIFSIISNTKANEDAVSDSGLSDVLGSLNKVGATRSSMSRPPLVINRAIVSPKSITEFSASDHDQSRNKEGDHPMRKNRFNVRGRLDRTQSTTDAIREGRRRALHEDDSNCVSLDSESHRPERHRSQNSVRDGSRYRETIRTTSSDRRGNGASKRDDKRLDRVIDDSSGDDQTRDYSTEGNNNVGERTTKHRSRKQNETTLEEDLYDTFVQPSLDSYNAVLESSIHVSNQLCDALQACWVDGDTSIDNQARDEKSVVDDLSGVHTEGESTAFNTLSSFSKCGLDDLNKRRLV